MEMVGGREATTEAESKSILSPPPAAALAEEWRRSLSFVPRKKKIPKAEGKGRNSLETGSKFFLFFFS